MLGITKAYTTRVGSGPFPTELVDEIGTRLATIGKEFGSVTGRPRRCGWFDGAALKRSVRLNGISGLCITKLDVLDGLETIQLGVGYRVNGEFRDVLPTARMPWPRRNRCWKSCRAGANPPSASPSTTSCRPPPAATWNAWPKSAACPSTRPDRNETIVLRHPLKGSLPGRS